jgi:hypothetical protein
VVMAAFTAIISSSVGDVSILPVALVHGAMV